MASFTNILGVGRKRVREVSMVTESFLRWAAEWIWMFYIKRRNPELSVWGGDQQWCTWVESRKVGGSLVLARHIPTRATQAPDGGWAIGICEKGQIF